ncbi:type IV pilus assembly protein FimV [Candidatus Ichthyocystis hellenicum]|uniref:type IV pilus assembly protein FimV n=1 Tax=Candidatus Ichthyocystis hellenicum TaxID=1561003 RepID=UPI000B877D19|nr:LysM peptidoglycan-binding domain-containing protein [Candidatus Ichthyocystis hellenicum]
MPNYKTKNYRFNRTRGLLSCAALLFPGISGAFSLGPLEVESYLGQQLSAKVVVYPSQMENLDDLSVDLESRDSEVYYGLESSSLPVMSQIKYSLEKQGDHSVVHFRSISIVDEPLISFSVNFSLGAQTIGRDFTVALDPQVFSKYSSTVSDNYDSAGDYGGDRSASDSYNSGTNLKKNRYDNTTSRNLSDPAFEHWSLDYDSDSLSDSDDWSELTEDLDAAVLSIDTGQLDSDHTDASQPAYVVQAGDTVKSIASRYAYPSTRAEDMANAILRMNNSLRSNVEGNLVPGQIVILPNPDQLNMISPDSSEELLSKEDVTFAKKKYYSHKHRPSYGEEKKVLRKKKVGKNHFLPVQRVGPEQKNIVRVESAVLSSTGLGGSDEDRISEQHKKSYNPEVLYSQVNTLKKEIEQLKQKIKDDENATAAIVEHTPSSVNNKSKMIDSAPVYKSISPPDPIIPEVRSHHAADDSKPISTKMVMPPVSVSAEPGNYDGDKSAIDLLLSLSTSPKAITVAVAVCVFFLIAYILVRRRRRVEENLLSNKRDINVKDVHGKGSSAEQKEYVRRNKYGNHEESTAWSGSRDWSVSDPLAAGGSMDESVMKHRVVDDPISEADVYVQYGRLDEAAKILEDEYQKEHDVEVSLRLAEIYHVMKRFGDITNLASGVLSAHGATSSDWSNFAGGMDKLNLGDYLPQGTASKAASAQTGSSFFSPGSLKKRKVDDSGAASNNDRKLNAPDRRREEPGKPEPDHNLKAPDRGSNVVSDNENSSDSKQGRIATSAKSGIDFVSTDKDKTSHAKTQPTESPNKKSEPEPEEGDFEDGLLNFDLDLSELNEDEDED